MSDQQSDSGAAVSGDSQPESDAAAPHKSDAPHAAERPVRQQPAPKRLVLCLIVAAIALTGDIATKIAVVATLSDREPVRLFGGALYLTEARNSGAAFGLGAGTPAATVLFTAVAAAVVAIIIRAARRLHSVGWAIGFGLVLGGALGNLTDRLLRAPGVGRGHVVDWVSPFAPDGTVYPIFNLADSAICCGAALAMLMALRGVEFDGRKTRDSQGGAAAQSSPRPAASTESTPAESTPAEPAKRVRAAGAHD